MRHQKEVNHYHWQPPRKTDWFVLTFCETCRLQLKGKVEVMRFGAELDVESLECSRCGYVMTNEPEERRDPEDERTPPVADAPRYHVGRLSVARDEIAAELSPNRTKGTSRNAHEPKVQPAGR